VIEIEQHPQPTHLVADAKVSKWHTFTFDGSAASRPLLQGKAEVPSAHAGRRGHASLTRAQSTEGAGRWLQGSSRWRGGDPILTDLVRHIVWQGPHAPRLEWSETYEWGVPHTTVARAVA
jgi:hypothetical protein